MEDITMNEQGESKRNVRLPPKPGIGLLIGCIITLLLAAFFIWGGVAVMYPDTGWLGVILLGALFGFIGFCLGSAYRSNVKKYRLAVSDYSAYQELIQKEADALDKYNQIMAENKKKREEEREATLPPCPICGSKKNVRRISDMNRAVSVATLGLASSKIGKQYECTHCKHKW